MDENRRKFLKIIFIGSGVFLMERVLGPVLSFFNDSPAKTDAKTSSSDKISFKGFQVVEDKKALSIYDSSGEEILQIDKKV